MKNRTNKKSLLKKIFLTYRENVIKVLHHSEKIPFKLVKFYLKWLNNAVEAIRSRLFLKTKISNSLSYPLKIC